MPIVRRYDVDPMLATMRGLAMGRRQHKLERDERKRLEKENESGLGGLGAGIGMVLGIVLAPFTFGASLAAGTITAAGAAATSGAIGGAVGGVAGSFVKTSGAQAQTLNTVGGAIGQLGSVAMQMQERKFVAGNIKSLVEQTRDMPIKEGLALWETAAITNQLGPKLQQRALGNLLRLASKVSFDDMRAFSKGDAPDEDEQARLEDWYSLMAEVNNPRDVVNALLKLGPVPEQNRKRTMAIAELTIDVMADREDLDAAQAENFKGMLGLVAREIKANPDEWDRRAAATFKAERETGLKTIEQADLYTGEGGLEALQRHQTAETTTGRSTEENLGLIRQMWDRTTPENGWTRKGLEERARVLDMAEELNKSAMPPESKSRHMTGLFRDMQSLKASGNKFDRRAAMTAERDHQVNELFDPMRGMMPIYDEAGRIKDWKKFDRIADPNQAKVEYHSPRGFPTDAEGNLSDSVQPATIYVDDALKIRAQAAEFALARAESITDPVAREAAKAAVGDKFYPEGLHDQLLDDHVKRYADPDFLAARAEEERNAAADRTFGPRIPQPAARGGAPQVPDGTPDIMAAARGEAPPSLDPKLRRRLDFELARFQANPNASPEGVDQLLQEILGGFEAAGIDPLTINREDSLAIVGLYNARKRSIALGESRQKRGTQELMQQGLGR